MKQSRTTASKDLHGRQGDIGQNILEIRKKESSKQNKNHSSKIYKKNLTKSKNRVPNVAEDFQWAVPYTPTIEKVTRGPTQRSYEMPIRQSRRRLSTVDEYPLSASNESTISSDISFKSEITPRMKLALDQFSLPPIRKPKEDHNAATPKPRESLWRKGKSKLSSAIRRK